MPVTIAFFLKLRPPRESYALARGKTLSNLESVRVCKGEYLRRWGLRSLQDERMFELWLGDRCLLLPTYLDDVHRVRDTPDRAT